MADGCFSRVNGAMLQAGHVPAGTLVSLVGKVQPGGSSLLACDQQVVPLDTEQMDQALADKSPDMVVEIVGSVLDGGAVMVSA
jgi:hypothetical protein